MSRWAVALLVVLTACAADPADSDPAPRSAPASPSPSVSAAAPSPTAGPPPAAELVVVSHATLPQLDLDRATAQRLVSGEVRRWRGLRVVRGRTPPDPRSLAVLPLSKVGPSVTVCRVDGVDPLRADPRAVQVSVVGDVMLSRGVSDPAAALRPMARRLKTADLTIGNLESTLSTDGTPTQGGDSFGGSPALVRPLRSAGFDALSLANNHVGDYGPRALRQTLRTLRDSPIVPFGAGADARDAAKPAVLEAGGTTFALLGFNAIGETPRATAGTPGAFSVRMPPRTGPLVPADVRAVTRAIRRAARRADVVLVLPHWGTQYTHVPEPIQRRVARDLVRAGADLVVGGHPHWVQGVDLVDGVPVVHSLGNFVFDMDDMEQTMEGVVLEATFWGPTLKALRFVPYRMDPGTFAPRVVRGEGILADLWSTSTGPFAG